MTDQQLLVMSVTIIAGTILVCLIMLATFAYKKKFNPVKALGLKPGLYQSRLSGDLIEVVRFNENMAYVCNDTGTWNIRYNILVDNYDYVGSL